MVYISWADDAYYYDNPGQPAPAYDAGGGEGTAGAQDTAGLSPVMNSAAGVDLGPMIQSPPPPDTIQSPAPAAMLGPVTTGGGPPSSRAIQPVQARVPAANPWHKFTATINGKKQTVKVKQQPKSSHPVKKRRK